MAAHAQVASSNVQLNDRYSLEGMNELDDAFFDTETKAKGKQAFQRGRGSKK
jgi:hypothetical protein